jgi:hypothetical protein
MRIAAQGRLSNFSSLKNCSLKKRKFFLDSLVLNASAETTVRVCAVAARRKSGTDQKSAHARAKTRYQVLLASALM